MMTAVIFNFFMSEVYLQAYFRSIDLEIKQTLVEIRAIYWTPVSNDLNYGPLFPTKSAFHCISHDSLTLTFNDEPRKIC